MNASDDAPQDPLITQWPTIEEAAKALAVSKRTAYDLVREGQVAATKYAGQWRVRPSSIRGFLERAARRAPGDQHRPRSASTQPPGRGPS